MPYKTILVHVDNTPEAQGRVAQAAQLALEHGAHLIGAAMVGLSRVLYQDAGEDLVSTPMAGHLANLAQQARTALDRFERDATAHGVRSFEARLVEDDAASGLARQARYADLVVVSQADPGSGAGRPGGGMLEHVLMTAARPLLVVPRAGAGGPPRHPLLAWNGSREGTRALTDALPLLTHASRVTLVQGDPVDDADADRLEVARHLRRHGVNAEPLVTHTQGDVGEALLRLAGEHGCDLVVAGGYGHARLREMVLGGVTASLLRQARLPLLLSH